MSENNEEDFQVGGVERQLSEEEQLAQLASYIYAHYEVPEKNPPWSPEPSDKKAIDTYDARLPDRTTHAAMLMLGAAVDHAMPGVAFPGEVRVESVPDIPGAQLFRPSNPTGRWAISLHPGGWWKGSGVALENAWRPEVAGAAELSGTTILDLDYPLLPEHTLEDVIAHVRTAAKWVRAQGPTSLASWGYSSGGALAVLCSELFDAQALTFPHLDLSMLPADLRGSIDFPPAAQWPRTLLQLATADTIAGRYPWAEEAPEITVKEYVSEHRLSTPEVARQRVRDVASFLNSYEF